MSFDNRSVTVRTTPPTPEPWGGSVRFDCDWWNRRLGVLRDGCCFVSIEDEDCTDGVEGAPAPTDNSAAKEGRDALVSEVERVLRSARD